MNMEPYTASLHAGLIQRARPAKVVPLREDCAPAARAAVVSLRASDIARARPAAAPAPLGIAELRAPSPAGGHAEPQIERAEATPAVPASCRRYGLTVRVSGELRDRLQELRLRTGRTAQSILHNALAAHLAALERRQTKR